VPARGRRTIEGASKFAARAASAMKQESITERLCK